MSWRRIALISCLHAGSRCAVWPAGFLTEDGVDIRASQDQDTMRQYWQDYCTREAASADTVILMGDLCQGKNPKDGGVGTMTPDLGEQIRAAVALLAPLCKGKKVLAISGSKYHDSMDTSMDMAVCSALGGRFLGAMKTLLIDGPGKYLNVCHGGASPTMYKATHEDRESMLLDAAIGSGNIKHPIDIVARGHWHYFQTLNLGHRLMVRVPGWQAWYPAKFMLDILGKKMNRFGAVTLDIGPDKTVVHERLYEPIAIYNGIEEA